jgi:hypothetical protein
MIDRFSLYHRLIEKNAYRASMLIAFTVFINLPTKCQIPIVSLILGQQNANFELSSATGWFICISPREKCPSWRNCDYAHWLLHCKRHLLVRSIVAILPFDIPGGLLIQFDFE